jgi:hypothetical protein
MCSSRTHSIVHLCQDYPVRYNRSMSFGTVEAQRPEVHSRHHVSIYNMTSSTAYMRRYIDGGKGAASSRFCCRAPPEWSCEACGPSPPREDMSRQQLRRSQRMSHERCGDGKRDIGTPSRLPRVAMHAYLTAVNDTTLNMQNIDESSACDCGTHGVETTPNVSPRHLKLILQCRMPARWVIFISYMRSPSSGWSIGQERFFITQRTRKCIYVHANANFTSSELPGD